MIEASIGRIKKVEGSVQVFRKTASYIGSKVSIE